MTIRFLLHGDRDELARSVPQAAGELGARGIAVRSRVRLADDPTAADPRAGAPAPAAVLEFDEFSEDAAAVVKMLEGVDPARSAVVAGQRVELLGVSDDARLVLMLALRRPPHMSLAECHAYWRDHHAPLAMSIPKLAGYAQHHAQPGESAQAASAAGFGVADFDGVAEIKFASVAELGEVMANPEVAETAFTDEQRFVDHARSALGLYEVCA